MGDLEVLRFKFCGSWKNVLWFLCVREEIEMIGRLMKVKFLIGKEVIKEEVFE